MLRLSIMIFFEAVFYLCYLGLPRRKTVKSFFRKGLSPCLLNNPNWKWDYILTTFYISFYEHMIMLHGLNLHGNGGPHKIKHAIAYLIFILLSFLSEIKTKQLMQQLIESQNKNSRLWQNERYEIALDISVWLSRVLHGSY